MPQSQRQLEERQLRKERILSGALQVFKKHGIDGATMDEIANESGFGKATLYYYFKSKEDVLTAILFFTAIFFKPILNCIKLTFLPSCYKVINNR